MLCNSYIIIRRVRRDRIQYTYHGLTRHEREMQFDYFKSSTII